ERQIAIFSLERRCMKKKIQILRLILFYVEMTVLKELEEMGKKSKKGNKKSKKKGKGKKGKGKKTKKGNFFNTYLLVSVFFYMIFLKAVSNPFVEQVKFYL